MKIYFINSKEKNCGVYQYGIRVWDILKDSDLDIEYFEIGSKDEFLALPFNNVDILFFNWIEGGKNGPFGWYNLDLHWFIKTNFNNIKTISIAHTFDISSTTFDYFVDQNPKNGGLIRPMYNFDLRKPKIKSDIINICSLGFAFDHKGFDDVVNIVNNQFDIANINLHITQAHYSDIHLQHNIINNLKKINLKPRIKLNISTQFLSNDEILDFIHNNDLVILAYKKGEDISSVPDYAISTTTPIAVTNIGQFKHLYIPEIDINLNSIENIISFYKTNNYMEYLYNQWNRLNFLDKFKQLIISIYND